MTKSFFELSYGMSKLPPGNLLIVTLGHYFKSII